jgi:hypothetical protein
VSSAITSAEDPERYLDRVLTEDSLEEDEDARSRSGELEDCGVSRVGPSVTRFNDIVTFCLQPRREAVTGTPIHEEFHFVTCMASDESRAMTA